MLRYLRSLIGRFFGEKRVKHTAQPPINRDVQKVKHTALPPINRD